MTEQSHSQKLHSLASNYNWDNGYDNLRDIINNPECDKGTALLIYWLSAPGYYCKYDSRDQVPNYSLENYDFVKELEEKYLSGKFVKANILFNPQWDRTTIDSKGYNWTDDYEEERQTNDIPELLKQPSIVDEEWEIAKKEGLIEKNNTNRLT